MARTGQRYLDRPAADHHTRGSRPELGARGAELEQPKRRTSLTAGGPALGPDPVAALGRRQPSFLAEEVAHVHFTESVAAAAARGAAGPRQSRGNPSRVGDRPGQPPRPHPLGHLYRRWCARLQEWTEPLGEERLRRGSDRSTAQSAVRSAEIRRAPQPSQSADAGARFALAARLRNRRGVWRPVWQ